jgi:hypothetical protein
MAAAARSRSAGPPGMRATKKAGRWPTLFCGSIPSNLGIGAEYSHRGPKGKDKRQGQIFDIDTRFNQIILAPDNLR